jgi:hypothetical protein
MSRYSYISSGVARPAGLAALLFASVSGGLAADRVQAQAQVLDHAEFLCANCFFGASKYYYCLAANDKILIGYQKTPVLNWQDQTKNDLAPVHPAWGAWTAPGQTVPITYDDKHIWISRNKPPRKGFGGEMKSFAFWLSRGDDKRVTLRRSELRDIFIHNEACRGAAGPKGP